MSKAAVDRAAEDRAAHWAGTIHSPCVGGQQHRLAQVPAEQSASAA